jgi:hypothetical protein
MNRNTFREIIDLLNPLMENQLARHALVDAALLDEPIVKRIDFSGAAQEFVSRLVTTLDKYGTISTGEPALVALLEALKEQVGFDKRQQIDRLIGALAQQTYQKPVVANEKHKRSLLETLLSSPLWTGISGIVTIFALIVAYMALPSQNQATLTPTPVPPSATLTLTSTLEPTATMTDTLTNTSQPTATDTATATDTSVPTSTDLPTATDTPEPTFTDAPTASNTPLPVLNLGVSPTASNTPLPVLNLGVSPTSAVIVRAYPCDAEIVFNSNALLNVVRGGPSSMSSYRTPILQGSEIIILSHVEENRNTFWYQIADSSNNILGWIAPQYVILSESCPP